MHVKKGDNVIVITGKDKGRSGKILRAFPKLDRVLVEGVNIKKVHERGKKQGSKGQIVEKAYPLHVSNVKIVQTKTKKQEAKS
ncbi:50S ribosomal protein L24 [Candidatus Parcubacteria bacterium]|nr:50S ribosomal protein L24 [Candidatus Parcubacteria bacterium]